MKRWRGDSRVGQLLSAGPGGTVGEFPRKFVEEFEEEPEPEPEPVGGGVAEVQRFLEELGLESWAKLTGGVGLHVVAPLERRQGWGTLKAFARVLAEQLAEEAPERFTASNRKAAREGKVFLDHLRNARSATTICPFSTRARAGVSVALPLRWDELARAHAYDVRAAARRLATLKGDPWEGFFEARQSITKAARRELGLE